MDMTAPLQADMDFQPLSTAFAQNPYPAYAALRARGEPVYFADFDIWLVTRFDDVAAIAQVVRAGGQLTGEAGAARS